MSIPAIIFYYIKTFFYSKNLAAAHTWTIRSIQINTFFTPLLFDVLFFLILFLICFPVIKKKNRMLGIFFIVWFILGLTIHLQLFPIDMTVADRFFYFPIIGLLALIGLFLDNLKLSRSGRYVSIGLAVVILTSLAIRTFIRNTNWYNQTTIVTHDERVENNDYLLELLMSTDLIQHGKFVEALPYAKKAVALYPQSWIAWGNVGLVYHSQNDYKRAKQAYLQSLSIANYYLAYENLALLLLDHETLTTARNFIIKANDLYPSSEKLWYYRIIASYKLGDNLDAIYAAKQYYILRQDQESYTILYNLQGNIPINIKE
jgi:tetratricopeptide (TPR) repeat protein